MTRRDMIAPAALALASLAAWEGYVRIAEVPTYVLPGPVAILAAVWDDRALLVPALLVTLRLTLIALGLAVAGGVLLASAFALSRRVERALFPYAVILQVTPVVAIAPLLQVYLDSAFTAAVICAWIVAFFPILANTAIGLRSVDPGLSDFFTIHGASRWQRLRLLAAPSALPYFLSGLRIAGGLALIGAVVAEFVIGRAGTGLGLAGTMLEASYRFNFPRLWAALFLISGLGVVVFVVTSALSHLLLRRWHDSARGDSEAAA
jgi:NitT/TauT family transport system permease protein